MSKTLAESNPHLKDPKQRAKMIFLSVASSSAVEGIRAPFLKIRPAPKATTAKQLGASRSGRGRSKTAK